MGVCHHVQGAEERLMRKGTKRHLAFLGAIAGVTVCVALEVISSGGRGGLVDYVVWAAFGAVSGYCVGMLGTWMSGRT